MGLVDDHYHRMQLMKSDGGYDHHTKEMTGYEYQDHHYNIRRSCSMIMITITLPVVMMIMI